MKAFAAWPGNPQRTGSERSVERNLHALSDLPTKRFRTEDGIGPAQAQGYGHKDEALTYVALLRACAKNKDLSRGTRLHEVVIKRGLIEACKDGLITMYARCGALLQAQDLLAVHKSRDVVTWTTLIGAFTHTGQVLDALDCFARMHDEDLAPDAVTFTCILTACGNSKAVDKGEEIHCEISKQGLLENNVVLGNALVDMYAKCGALERARQVFEELRARDLISWNVLMTGYVQEDDGTQVLECFERMQQEGLCPDAFTFSCVLKACGSIGAVEKGGFIHDEIRKQGLLKNNIVLGTALVDMCARCLALTKASQVLAELPVRNVTCWNALITGFVQQGEGAQALKCFEQMRREGITPNAVSYICILGACASAGSLDRGEENHDEISKRGLLRGNVRLGSALVDMYARCGALGKARCVLEDLPVRNTISWNALMVGCTHYGNNEQALECYVGMQHDGILPDSVSFSCILKACGSIGAADRGEEIQREISKQGLLRNSVVLGNALVDMYAKCGALAKAQKMLEELPVRDALSWNALITGYAQHCENAYALWCYQEMQREGLSPDSATFSCVLAACSRLGLVEYAWTVFLSMSATQGVKPDLQHYTSMVDLLGRAGHLEKAVQVIDEMSWLDSGLWCALLGACREWGDVNVGGWAFEHGLQVNKGDSSFYVLMSSLCAAAGVQESGG